MEWAKTHKFLGFRFPRPKESVAELRFVIAKPGSEGWSNLKIIIYTNLEMLHSEDFVRNDILRVVQQTLKDGVTNHVF